MSMLKISACPGLKFYKAVKILECRIARIESTFSTSLICFIINFAQLTNN